MGVVILCIAIEMFFLTIVIAIIEPTSPNFLALFIILSGQCFVAYDSDTYSRRVYMLLMESRSYMRAKIMTDNEHVVMEMQSTELRFLIGNVAHDLKTPLQAFSFELEQMKSQPGAQSCKESILLLESIGSFMLMTVNRAIDYTKVTSGIKLKPSLETVDVDGVFNWVKKCIEPTMTSRSVSIVVEPFPVVICNCIITDKQWLMENLLCLISNAQKFTAHGAIRIKYCFAAEFVPPNNTTGGTGEGVGAGAGEVVYEEGLQLPAPEVSISARHESERTANSKSRSYSSTDSVPSLVMVEVIDDGIGISEGDAADFVQAFQASDAAGGWHGLGHLLNVKACGESGRNMRGFIPTGWKEWGSILVHLAVQTGCHCGC
jgi:signal transduction histidine kinase